MKIYPRVKGGYRYLWPSLRGWPFREGDKPRPSRDVLEGYTKIIMKSAVLKQKLVNVILEMTSYIRLDFRKLGIHKKHSFSLRFYLASVEVLQTDTLVSGQLYLRPYSQNPVSLNSRTQTLYFYIPVSSQLQLQTPFFESRVCPYMRASTVS